MCIKVRIYFNGLRWFYNKIQLNGVVLFCSRCHYDYNYSTDAGFNLLNCLSRVEKRGYKPGASVNRLKSEPSGQYKASPLSVLLLLFLPVLFTVKCALQVSPANSDTENAEEAEPVETKVSRSTL